MEIEDVARIGCTAWRAAEEERHLTISHGLLREIVVNDQSVLTIVPKILTHRNTAVRCKELHGRRIRSARGNHRGVFHRTMTLQLINHLRDRGLLLPDGDVDAVNVRVLLVDDVVTTGGAIFELIELVKSMGAVIVGIAVMFDRTGEEIDFGFPTCSLYSEVIESWEPIDCPQCKQGTPLTQRGRTGK